MFQRVGDNGKDQPVVLARRMPVPYRDDTVKPITIRILWREYGRISKHTSTVLLSLKGLAVVTGQNIPREQCSLATYHECKRYSFLVIAPCESTPGWRGNGLFVWRSP